MKILIVNDDGIKSPGIKLLAEQLKDLGDIYIFAPKHHQSGMSQALSIRKKIKVKNHGSLYGVKKAYSAKGTPADCTRLALFIFDNIKFDLVVSGINQGANLGSDVLRSGTVGAATEAASLGIPAIAISSPYNDFSMALAYTKKIVKSLYDNKLVSSDYVLNINFPKEIFKIPKGIMFTTQGKHKHMPVYVKKSLNKYLAIYRKIDLKEDEISDAYCYKEGIISITPVFEDRSNASFSKKLNNEYYEQLNQIVNYDKIKV